MNNRYLNIMSCFLIWALIIIGQTACGKKDKNSQYLIFDHYPYSVLKDKKSDSLTIQKALNILDSLRAQSAPSTFWTTIANDSAYILFLRKYAIKKLTCRFITVGMSLQDLRNTIGNSLWLQDGDVIQKFSGTGIRKIESPECGGVFCVGDNFLANRFYLSISTPNVYTDKMDCNKRALLFNKGLSGFPKQIAKI